ncbi:hypothetical protein B0H66DRAFT_337137 [Apodospora peruviana]|uniref:Uncharacterized protein n=1 Tax=Apodospora peruviana TaxID=516989 RepID=A0AAE0HYP0_9PEZI|nr:hypothetical protein B0H66DRAFT_337137 [Apodospora peruviana]
MSGSGGFYKYRCKHFYTYNCNNWVYVNGAACASCLADGREAVEAPSGAASMGYHQQSREQHIQVPRWVSPGEVHWDLCRMITGTRGNDWTVEYVEKMPLIATTAVNLGNINNGVVSNMVTNDTPRPVMTTTGIGNQNLRGY